MTTAFQDNAFQFTGFQIDPSGDTHDGGEDHGHKRKFYLPIYVNDKVRGREIPLDDIIEMYEETKEQFPDSKDIISAIDPYIIPETGDELDRRLQAQYVITSMPDFSRIRMEYLLQNEISLTRLLNALEIAKERISQQNDDNLLIMLAAAIC